MLAYSRRSFLISASAGIASLRLGAQPLRRNRIGFMGNSTAALEANLVGPFREGLRQLGYVEGANLTIEYRWAEGDYTRFPNLVTELANLGVEVIVTAGTPAALAAQKNAPNIPLVMAAVGDPVAAGLVRDLAHPGGNTTGLSAIAPDLEGKRIELLQEVAGKPSHIALLTNPSNPFHFSAEKQARVACEALRIKLTVVPVRSSDELASAFQTITRTRADALIMLADRVFLHERRKIVQFAAANRLPAVYAYRELVDAGGLMSFGPSYADMHRRAAIYVDKILRGAKPGDLPIELPSKFELIINPSTAKTLGITIPQSVLVRADELIQ
jgi:putative ABC transport system substrate-binding protein